MKYTVIAVLCLAFLCQGCFETNRAYVMGNPESEGVIGARLGTEIAQNLEVGASLLHGPGKSKTTTERVRYRCYRRKTTTREEENDWFYGVYSILHLGNETVDPYVGGQAALQQGNMLKTLQPIGGVAVGPLFAEYQHESLNGEDDKVMFGLRFRF